MKLIVGLGNPGKRYEWTRHNVGFKVVNRLQNELYKKTGLGVQTSSSFKAEIYQDNDVLLLWPQTYMNRSGEAVNSVVRFYKVPLEKLYVVHDDLDIGLGQYKIQKGKGPKQHNGLQSIYTALGEKDFWHVRVGIENRQRDETKISGEEYVLQPFNDQEREKIGGVVESVAAELQTRVVAI